MLKNDGSCFFLSCMHQLWELKMCNVFLIFEYFHLTFGVASKYTCVNLSNIEYVWRVYFFHTVWCIVFRTDFRHLTWKKKKNRIEKKKKEYIRSELPTFWLADNLRYLLSHRQSPWYCRYKRAMHWIIYLCFYSSFVHLLLISGGSGQHKLSIIPPEAEGYNAYFLKTLEEERTPSIFLHSRMNTSPIPPNAHEFWKMPKATCRVYRSSMSLQVLAVHVKSCVDQPSGDDFDLHGGLIKNLNSFWFFSSF